MNRLLHADITLGRLPPTPVTLSVSSSYAMVVSR